MASKQIIEEVVYLCTGNLMPKDIEQIAFWLLIELFSTSFKYVSDMKMRKGLALIDIIREVTMFVFKIKMPSDVRVKLINDLADIEYRLTFDKSTVPCVCLRCVICVCGSFFPHHGELTFQVSVISYFCRRARRSPPWLRCHRSGWRRGFVFGADSGCLGNVRNMP